MTSSSLSGFRKLRDPLPGPMSVPQRPSGGAPVVGLRRRPPAARRARGAVPRLSRRGASAMANLQKTTAPKFRRKNSCPDGWLHAGAKVPIRLTVRQEEYCRQAIDIHRFCYNLAVRPTGSAAATGSSGPAGWTSARPSTPASGRTTPSSPRSQPLLPPAPSGTSARPWTTGATPNSGPGSQKPSAGHSPAPAPSWRPAA